MLMADGLPRRFCHHDRPHQPRRNAVGLGGVRNERIEARRIHRVGGVRQVTAAASVEQSQEAADSEKTSHRTVGFLLSAQSGLAGRPQDRERASHRNPLYTINFHRQIQRSADWKSAAWYARDHSCEALKLAELLLLAAISCRRKAKRGNRCRLALRERDEPTSPAADNPQGSSLIRYGCVMRRRLCTTSGARMAERGGRQQERSQDGPSTPLRTSYATSGSEASCTHIGSIRASFVRGDGKR